MTFSCISVKFIILLKTCGLDLALFVSIWCNSVTLYQIIAYFICLTYWTEVCMLLSQPNYSRLMNSKPEYMAGKPKSRRTIINGHFYTFFQEHTKVSAKLYLFIQLSHLEYLVPSGANFRKCFIQVLSGTFITYYIFHFTPTINITHKWKPSVACLHCLSPWLIADATILEHKRASAYLEATLAV